MAKIIFLDMDGVIARRSVTATAKQFASCSYFAKREPEKNLIEAVKFLSKKGVMVCILSCADGKGIRKTKRTWLSRQGLPQEQFPAYFPAVGESKAEYLLHQGIKMENAVLIDDYGTNLADWEQNGGKAVKFFNGTNGTKGKKYAHSVEYNWSAEKISNYLLSLFA